MLFTKNPYWGLLLCNLLAIFQAISAEVGKLVCFYDTKRLVRESEFIYS